MALFHFDLRHVPDADALRVQILGSDYELNAHGPEGPQAAGGPNLALGALPDDGRLRFSHAAEVDDDHFEDDQIRFVQVVRPTDPDIHLDECVLMGLHIPERYLRAYYHRSFKRYASKSVEELRLHHRANLQGKPRVHSGQLAALGVEALPEDPDEAIELLLHTQLLVDTAETACTFVQHHPNLANVQPATAAVVRHDHIYPDPAVDPDQFNAIQALSRAIEGQEHWSEPIECRDKDDKPIKADFALKDKDTGKGFDAGQQLYTWDVAQPVLDVAVAPMAGACRSSADDPSLSDHAWTPTPGTSVVVKDAADVHPELEATDTSEPAYKWTVDDETVHYGIGAKASSIKIDSSDNFSIDVRNWHNRTFYVGYYLLDENKAVVGQERLLEQFSAGQSIAGIPCPIDPTTLTVPLEGHAGVTLTFGSLGTSDWDPDVSWRGALLTGFWNYGVPVFFIAIGQKLTATKTYERIMNDPDTVKALIAIGGSLATAGIASYTAIAKSAKYLISLANTVASMILKKGMEAFAEWLAGQVTAAAISSAFGPVGWVFKGAAALMNVEGMVITTAEVLASPATVRVTCSRAIDVTVKVHPDPKHGESGHPETAIWPALAQRWYATLMYRDGTSRILHDELSKSSSNQPVAVKFADIPADGEFRILFGVYSASGWLAGSWQSDWTKAKPNTGTTLDLGDHTIKESLVPLAGDTQYVFKERIAFTNGAFVWQPGGAPPATTQAALDCGPSGTLCELVGATFNNSAFQLGYAWRSSGQNLPPDNPSAPPSNAQLYSLQNLSVLGDPGSRRIRADVGLTNRPALAYAPSTNASDRIDQTNFVVDPRAGGMHLRQVLLDGSQPTFGLGAHDLKSWGSFPLENVDAAAVHPSNAVIACSWKNRKLMILPLPAAPSPDDKAPTAIAVSGQGLREGLMQGPVALAVAPDGRILVLETLNKRVQAFDTKGNPVPSFTPGPVLFELDTAAVAPTLDKGEVPDALQDALHAAGAGLLCTIDASFAAQLDSAKYKPDKDPLVEELATHQIALAYDPEHLDDPAASTQIKVVKKGSSWTITDPRQASWQLLAEDGAISVYPRIGRPEIRAEKRGERWLVVDGVSGAAFKLEPAGSAGRTAVKNCRSYFTLKGMRGRDLTFLDLAVEAQGYVYVLSHQQDGSEPSDHLLDVYAPDGEWLFRTPDPSLSKTPQNVVAGKLAVDVWRNLYALTYETVHGPNGDPQPGVAHWIPTPPLFTLPLARLPGYRDRNIGAVQQDFGTHSIKLSNQAFVTTVAENAAWQVKDGTAAWDVFRSGDGLQVYTLSG